MLTGFIQRFPNIVTAKVSDLDHGAVTSLSTVALRQNETYTFTAVASSGYYIGRVYVDGVNVGSPQINNGVYYYTYKNTDISKNHTVLFQLYTSTGAPSTGDDSGSNFWSGLLALSGMLTLGAVSALRKRKAA